MSNDTDRDKILTILPDIINMREWELGIFMTYSLSLTFFESVIVKYGKIKEIWVIADIDGYQMSLSERHSKSIGQEYRLIPVRMKSGIFHPKSAFLSSKDGDVLAIGSGNLTYGGYGRNNIEVYEIFDSKISPNIFRQFCNFVVQTFKRDDLFIPNKEWISHFDYLKYSDNTDVISFINLVYPEKTSVLDKIIDMMEYNQVKEINILSPYYGENAKGVIKLCEVIKPKKINISLTPSNSTTFPFGSFKIPGVQIFAVVPVVPDPTRVNIKDDKRFLHAKWIDFIMNDNSKYSLYGSINATHTALCTTDNVELGVFRKAYKNQWVNWEKTDKPKIFIQEKYHKSGSKTEGVIYAVLKGSTVTCQVMGHGIFSGNWKYDIISSDNENHSEGCIEIPENGYFKLTIRNSKLANSISQIIIYREDLIFRGWLHNDDNIRLRKHIPSKMLYFRQFENNQSTIEDEIELFQYIIQAFSDQIHISTVFKSKVKKKNKIDDEDVLFDLDIIKPEELSSSDMSGNRVHISGVDDSAYIRILEKFRKTLLADETKSEKNYHSQIVSSSITDDEGNDDIEVVPEYNFEDFIDDLISDVYDKAELCEEERRSSLLVILLEILIHINTKRLKSTNVMIAAEMQFWLLKTSELCKYSDNDFSIAQHVAATAVSLIYINLHDPNINPESKKEYQINIKTQIDRFFITDMSLFEKYLFDIDVLKYIQYFAISQDEIWNSFHILKNTITYRDYAVDILTKIKNGSYNSIELPAKIPIYDIFLKELNRKKAKIPLTTCREVNDTYVCSGCNLENSSIYNFNIKKYRIAKCEHCGKYSLEIRL